MKRQKSLLDFVKKKASKTDRFDSSHDNYDTLPMNDQSTSNIILSTVNTDISPFLPDCWTIDQYENFKKKYDGLFVRNKKLGCNFCAKRELKSINKSRVSDEWACCSVEASGNTTSVMQASLRKKLKKHFSSKAHDLRVKQEKYNRNDAITKCIDKANEKYVDSTCRIFNTVYSLVKRCIPFSDIKNEIELQSKNGIEMGIGLHSRRSTVKIIDHIAKDIKEKIFTKIIDQNLRICIIVDESSTISNKPVLIIFLKIEDSSYASPTIFFDLVELEGQGAEQIYTSMVKSLCNGGFSNEYLKNNLVAFCSDGASVMLGRNSGVGTRLKNDYPNIILWHCLNHCLQLILDDSVDDIKQVNYFKMFMDKIYTIFHQSNKNQMELFRISETLGQQILKIGRVLGSRWAACSLRSTLAVWRAYPVLYKFFSTKSKYSGMATYFCHKSFLENLALMIDILQEISLLSNALQARNLSVTKADLLIKRTIKAFEILKENKGTYEKEVDVLITSDSFKDISFIENNRIARLPRKNLLESVLSNMKKRLISCDDFISNNNEQDEKLFNLINLVDLNSSDIEKVFVPWLTAEEKLRKFGELFHHEIDINEFRDYVASVLKNSCDFSKVKIPYSIQKAKNIINTIAVSSAEAERGFSKMNIIYSDDRNRLLVSNVTNLLIINLVGLPFNSWDPIPSVKKWLRKNHRSADYARVKRTTDKEIDDNQSVIWRYLK